MSVSQLEAQHSICTEAEYQNGLSALTLSSVAFSVPSIFFNFSSGCVLCVCGGSEGAQATVVRPAPSASGGKCGELAL